MRERRRCFEDGLRSVIALFVVVFSTSWKLMVSAESLWLGLLAVAVDSIFSLFCEVWGKRC